MDIDKFKEFWKIVGRVNLDSKIKEYENETGIKFNNWDEQTYSNFGKKLKSEHTIRITNKDSHLKIGTKQAAIDQMLNPEGTLTTKALQDKLPKFNYNKPDDVVKAQQYRDALQKTIKNEVPEGAFGRPLTEDEIARVIERNPQRYWKARTAQKKLASFDSRHTTYSREYKPYEHQTGEQVLEKIKSGKMKLTEKTAGLIESRVVGGKQASRIIDSFNRKGRFDPVILGDEYGNDARMATRINDVLVGSESDKIKTIKIGNILQGKTLKVEPIAPVGTTDEQTTNLANIAKPVEKELLQAEKQGERTVLRQSAAKGLLKGLSKGAKMLPIVGAVSQVIGMVADQKEFHDMYGKDMTLNDIINQMSGGSIRRVSAEELNKGI